MMRSHGCGALRPSHENEEVRLAGWVHHIRDHKGVTFLDLRDATGEVQVVFHPDEAPDAAALARDLGREWCILAGGRVARRPEGMENPRLGTGEIEVRADRLEILAASETPPFLIEDDLEADEALRLRYRYLDLRRPVMQRNLRLRHRAIRAIRDYLDGQEFVEVETPMLFRATPEGARDFLVPSRIQPGSFYALPQSPQLLKQILMIGGIDRYYQIARAFRDEDLRADRQLEFTQLDLEMAFADEEDVLAVMEDLSVHVWRECLGVEIPRPFPRIAYAEAIKRFGTDRVDLRYGMELVTVDEVFRESSLGIFQRVLKAGGTIRAVGVPGGGSLNPSQLKRLEQQAMEWGAKGLAWVIFREGGEVDSPLAKHLAPAEREGLAKALAGGPGDLALIVADEPRVANPVLGALRMQLAADLGLVPEGEWGFCWVIDPPLFEWNGDENRWDALHHPFTMPAGDPVAALDGDPGSVRARAYDLVLNGVELGTGSVRIHRPEIQERVLGVIGIDAETARDRFGFLLDAYRYGGPPHAGIATGLDRTVMLMAGATSLRDVTAFPKVQSGMDPLSGAPTPVDAAQLAELGLRLRGR